jgi:hypothetical protein
VKPMEHPDYCCNPFGDGFPGKNLTLLAGLPKKRGLPRFRWRQADPSYTASSNKKT